MEENERPWGRYDILCEKTGYKVKIITINPGHRFSLQKHSARDEYWTIVHGAGTVTLNGLEKEVQIGSSIEIRRGTPHRAKAHNGGLKFIEVQIGDYLGEDDIERIEDDYRRK